MKRRILIALGTLIATLVLAGDPQNTVVPLTGASTNATAIGADDVATNAIPITGWVDALYLDFSGYATATVDVDVVTSGGTTIFSADNLTADKWYYPREIADTTAGVEITGEPVEIPVTGQNIIVSVYAANTGGVINVKATLYYK